MHNFDADVILQKETSLLDHFTEFVCRQRHEGINFFLSTLKILNAERIDLPPPQLQPPEGFGCKTGAAFRIKQCAP